MEPSGEAAEAAEAPSPSGEIPELVKMLMAMGIEKELATQVGCMQHSVRILSVFILSIIHKLATKRKDNSLQLPYKGRLFTYLKYHFQISETKERMLLFH